MRVLEPEMQCIHAAASCGQVNDDLWRMACQATLIAGELIPVAAASSATERRAFGPKTAPAHLALLALCAPDVSVLRDRLLGSELHFLLDQRRESVASFVIRQLGEDLFTGRGPCSDRSAVIAHVAPILRSRDPQAFGAWPVLASGSPDRESIARARDAVGDIAGDLRFHDLARSVLELLHVDVPAAIDDLAQRQPGNPPPPVREPELSRAVALLAPREAQASAEMLQPWAAMLAGSAPAAIAATDRATELSASQSRGTLVAELFKRPFDMHDAAPRPSKPAIPASTARNRPKPGELWLTADQPAKAIVLVLPFDPANDGALLVAPVDPHSRVAGATDLLLHAEHSDLGCDLRVVLGLEDLIDVSSLGARLASIDTDLLRQLGNAALPDDAYGSSPLAEQDPWLMLEAPLSRALANISCARTAAGTDAAAKRDSGAEAISSLWRTISSVWDPDDAAALTELFEPLPADVMGTVLDLGAVITEHQLHDAARDIAYGRSAMAASKGGRADSFWPITAASHPTISTRVLRDGFDSVLAVDGLPAELENLTVVVVLADAIRCDCPWWNGLEGVLAGQGAVAAGRVAFGLGEGRLTANDLGVQPR